MVGTNKVFILRKKRNSAVNSPVLKNRQGGQTEGCPICNFRPSHSASNLRYGTDGPEGRAVFKKALSTGEKMEMLRYGSFLGPRKTNGQRG